MFCVICGEYIRDKEEAKKHQHKKEKILSQEENEYIDAVLQAHMKKEG